MLLFNRFLTNLSKNPETAARRRKSARTKPVRLANASRLGHKRRSAAQPPRTKRSIMPHSREHQPTILTIDDDEVVRHTLAAWIRDAGYQALEAANAPDGLAALQARRPDLVLLDLRMPGMDGLAFLHEKNARTDDTPVIVVSGHADLQNAISAFRLGAADYILKPLENFELLEHAVSAVLESRRLARKVRQAEARYTNLVHNVPLVIFSLDENLELTFVNRACQDMLGYTQAQALSQPGWLLRRVHPGDRNHVEQALRQTLNGCDPHFSKTCRFLHKSGRLVHGVIKPIPAAACGAPGGTDAIEGVIIDITDRLMLEKHLVQKEKLKTLGAISAEVAHEIRNPLVAIGGFARRLLKKDPGQADARIILHEAQRLESLLDRIRDYLSPVRMQRATLHLDTIARDCLELLAPAFNANNVTPHLELDPGLPTVEQDPDLLTQVIINLLRTTLEALPPKGRMWIRTFPGEGFVHLEVRGDRATPVEDVEKIFLPFEDGGHFIGLPFSYRLLRSMGGSLSFEQKDAQSAFLMSVPRA